jgi:hypothetical protein
MVFIANNTDAKMAVTTTYTVTSSEGEYPRRNLTLAQAADEILSSDSREWEIRSEDGIWRIWSRQQVANIGWHSTAIISVSDSREDAEIQMFKEVVRDSWNWRGHDHAITDIEYDQMVAENANDEI